MSGTIDFRAEAGIATLTIDAPERLNALSLAMWASLPDLVARADRDASVRVIAVTGAGTKAFSAGADISRFAQERGNGAAAAHYDDIVAIAETALAHAAKPTVALINGLCFGGGMGVALGCDIRMAISSAQFRLPAARLGIGYAYSGVERLARAVGNGNAAHILFAALPFDAAQALAWGLVQQVVADEAFGAAGGVLLHAIAENAPLSIKAAKAPLRELTRPESQRDLARVEAAVTQCYESADYREGRAAFTGKRKAVFKGE